MGSGFFLACPHCDYSEPVRLGIGKLFPEVYRETEEAFAWGKYGEKRRRAFLDNKGAVICIEEELFQCPRCNALKSCPNLSLYTTTEENLGSYWSVRDLKGCKLLMEYRHRCPACRKTMRRIGGEEEVGKAKLPCPKCGAALEIQGGILWD